MNLVMAALSVCLAAQPLTCTRTEFRIERRACGLAFQAEIPLSGQWQAAQARIICEGKG